MEMSTMHVTYLKQFICNRGELMVVVHLNSINHSIEENDMFLKNVLDTGTQGLENNVLLIRWSSFLECNLLNYPDC